MDFPKHSKTHSAVLLVSEIENLQAQARLMEICFKEAQLAAENRIARMEEQYNGELSGLRAALTSAVENARAENAVLRAQIVELESAASAVDRRAQESARGLHAARRLEELRTELHQTLKRQPTEEIAMKTGDSNEQLGGNPTELRETGETQSDLKQSLRNEIDRLLHEAREKNQILQDRNDELVRVKAEMDRLQERLNQLESSTIRSQSALAGDAERMHTEFQAQLALLQAELSQKEWALDEKQAAVRGLEQKYRQEIEALRRQLEKRELAVNPEGGEFVSGERRPNRRRWHSGFGRKRRWRQ